MAIKLVTLEQAKEPKPKYPYFGRHKDGSIVFFTSREAGVCIIAPKGIKGGYHAYGWIESNFTPIEGPITFQNEF